MTEPTTQAGRDADQSRYHGQRCRDWTSDRTVRKDRQHRPCTCGLRDRILAIEAEARDSVAPATVGSDSEAHVTAGNNATGLREALMAHWITTIECDHETKQDTVRCACSVWTGTPQPTVGDAVQQWIDHVQENLASAGVGTSKQALRFEYGAGQGSIGVRAEARDATALREALDATALVPEDAPRLGTAAAEWYDRGWTDRGDALRAALATSPPEPCCVGCGAVWDEAHEALAARGGAAPPEPRWPSRDELSAAIHASHFVGRQLTMSDLEYDDRLADSILAALREGGERP